jgi:hypothetical protein
MAEHADVQTARENLLYIRKTMEAAGQFTAVSGKSLVAAGFAALAGAAMNGWVTGTPWSLRPDPRPALTVWGIVLIASLAIVLFGIYRKNLQLKTSIRPPQLRRLLWSLCPALFVGALLTVLVVRSGNLDWLPVVWLGCYGAAVTNGGLVSVAPIRYMGLCFLAAAAGAALSPREAGLAWLALGFGWLHIVYGAHIARRHNG